MANERLGLIDAWMIASRIRWLLTAKLPAQLTMVDDTCNAIADAHATAHGWAAAKPEEKFTTHFDVANIDIGDPSSSAALSMLIAPALERVSRGFIRKGPSAGNARVAEDVELDIVIAASMPGTTEPTEDGDDDDWTQVGAMARACRIERATVGVLTRYHRLPVTGLPGGDLGTLVEDTRIGKTGRKPPPENEKDEPQASLVELVVPLTCTTRRVVRTS